MLQCLPRELARSLLRHRFSSPLCPSSLEKGPLVKTLSLWQPWASLVALGVKTIETRSWSTEYRGPLAIHASARESALHYLGWLEEHQGEAEPALTPLADRITMVHAHRHGVVKAKHDLPLGAIVATCTLVDVVPIDRWANGPHVGDFPHDGPLRHQQGGLWLIGTSPLNGGTPTRIEDQRPYGDFTPGRYAWLLADIMPVNPPVPARGRQRLFNIDALLTKEPA